MTKGELLNRKIKINLPAVDRRTGTRGEDVPAEMTIANAIKSGQAFDADILLQIFEAIEAVLPDGAIPIL